MPKCALPEHLKKKLHNDWPWPLCYIPRAWTSFGVRCSEWPGRWREFPFLIIGYNVTRWKDGKDNDIRRNNLKGLRIWEKDIRMGPAALQKGETWGFQLSWPLYFSIHYIIKEADEDIVFFFRIGGRKDSLDGYYSFPSICLGLHWE